MFCHITSSVESDPHQKLLGQKGGRGFPHVVFMDGEGNVLAKHEGARSVAGFRGTARTAEALIDLRKKAEAGDPEARIEFFFKQLELSHLTAAQARERLQSFKDLPGAKRAEAEERIVGLEIEEVLADVTEDKATQREAGRKFAEMKKAGRVPKDETAMQPFWVLILEHAEAVKDADLFEEGLAALRAEFGDNPRAAGFFRAKEEILQKLRGQ